MSDAEGTPQKLLRDRVALYRDGGIAHVQLARPEKRNGLDYDMFVGVIEAAELLEQDPSVRAVVLSGQGKAFCAGLDFPSFLAMGPDGPKRLLARAEGEAANVAQRVAWCWAELSAPVIAAVHGACLGGGLQIALAADIRIVHPEASMSVREIQWGLIPDMSISQTLPRLVGIDVARELTYTGRKVTGDEARRLGLATRLDDDPIDAALTLAREIAGKNPEAIRAAKRLYADAPTLGVEAGLRLETELQLPLLGSANQMEAVQAQFEGRDPVFSDPASD